MSAKAAVFSFAAFLAVTTASAQSIEVGSLDDAQAFSAGVMDLQSGGLDANAWNGTRATLAAKLVERLPANFDNPVARDLMRAALLSDGVPPEGTDTERAAYAKARSDYLLASGQSDILASLAERDLGLARDRTFQVDLALERGDTGTACATAEATNDGRADPYWAKLRAFCFAKDGNIPAAELTAELLGSSGHEDAVFDALLRGFTTSRTPKGVTPETPLHRAMMASLGMEESRETNGELDSLLSRMDMMSPDEMLPAMSALAAGTDTASFGVSYGFDDVRDDDSDTATARLYVLAVGSRDAMAMGEFLSRMARDGRFELAANHLENRLRAVSGQDAARGGLDLFVRAAVLRRDTGALSGMFSALERGTDDARRVALISDALGGGFRFSPVGEDVEEPFLSGESAGGAALRDLLIATGLGGRLSDAATLRLEEAVFPQEETSVGARLALRAAAERGARAETALRAARLLASDLDAVSLSEVIAALNAAGLSEFAGQVAAHDLVQRL